MNLQKDLPYRSKGYMDYIKGKPCLMLYTRQCTGEVVAHHLKGGKPKGSDLSCIPLCYWHHIGELHQHGRQWFEEWHNMELEHENHKINQEYIERLEAK